MVSSNPFSMFIYSFLLLLKIIYPTRVIMSSSCTLSPPCVQVYTNLNAPLTGPLTCILIILEMPSQVCSSFYTIPPQQNQHPGIGVGKDQCFCCRKFGHMKSNAMTPNQTYHNQLKILRTGAESQQIGKITVWLLYGQAVLFS